jgi:hypothetical protein
VSVRASISLLLVFAGLLAGLLAGSQSACLGTTSSANCAQYDDCSTCTMDAACSFCLETNLCIKDEQPCAGDRAQTPDMCVEP